jgi:hypothetical protein
MLNGSKKDAWLSILDINKRFACIKNNLKIIFKCMPQIKSELQHNLSKQEAIERIAANCIKAKKISDLKNVWFQNIMDFSVSIQGVNISGKIEVTENTVTSICNLPFIAVPFKSWIPNILRNLLKQGEVQGQISGNFIKEPLILYLHIPKAGGITMGDFIYSQLKQDEGNDEGLIKNGIFFMPDGFFRENEIDVSIEYRETLKRNDLRAVIGHFAFGIHHHVYRPCYYITILRNPIERIVSLYHYLQLGEKMSLEEFANFPPYREIDNDQTRRIAGVNPPTGKCTQEHLELAKKNLIQHFSVVGTTERFDETLALLVNKFNWQKAVSSYPKNVNTAKPASSSLSQSTVNAIQNSNLHDIELYKFGNQLMDDMICEQGEKFLNVLKKQKELNT